MQNTAVQTITPLEARAKMQDGAVLLDVREYLEWLESHIPGATLIPLGELKNNPQRGALAPEVLTLCRSGKRATEAAQTLAAAGVTTPFVVKGGIEEWKAAGLPTQKAEVGPISMERQVRIGAGVLVAARFSGAASARDFLVRAVRADFRGRDRLVRHGQSAGEDAVESSTR